MSTPPPPLMLEADAVTRITRWVAVGALLALIALCLAWELWLAPYLQIQAKGFLNDKV